MAATVKEDQGLMSGNSVYLIAGIAFIGIIVVVLATRKKPRGITESPSHPTDETTSKKQSPMTESPSHPTGEKHCISCGAKLGEQEIFCRRCGRSQI